jgi:endonuclease YncB( thermonuclease family)
MTTDKTYEYPATIVRVVDGDTVYLKLFKEFALDVDFGFNIKDTVKLAKEAVVDFRLRGINAPEMKGATKTAGNAARVELERLLNLGSIRVVAFKPEKYGRYLADIYVTPAQGAEFLVNSSMIENGFATPFMV